VPLDVPISWSIRICHTDKGVPLFLGVCIVPVWCLFQMFPSTSQCSVFADTSFPIPFVQHYVNNYAFETMLWDSVSKYLACCYNSIVFGVKPISTQKWWCWGLQLVSTVQKETVVLIFRWNWLDKQAQFGHKLFKGGHSMACAHHWWSSCKLPVKNNTSDFW
jgi:hypothetical protein